MSDKGLEQFAKDQSWVFTSAYIQLTPEQIDKYKDKVDWKYISLRQGLTLEQLIKYRNYIKIKDILLNKHVCDLIKDKLEFGVFYE